MLFANHFLDCALRMRRKPSGKIGSCQKKTASVESNLNSVEVRAASLCFAPALLCRNIHCHTRFSSGDGHGAATPGQLEIPQGQQQSEAFRWGSTPSFAEAPHQAGTKFLVGDVVTPSGTWDNLVEITKRVFISCRICSNKNASTCIAGKREAAPKTKWKTVTRTSCRVSSSSYAVDIAGRVHALSLLEQTRIVARIFDAFFFCSRRHARRVAGLGRVGTGIWLHQR